MVKKQYLCTDKSKPNDGGCDKKKNATKDVLKTTMLCLANFLTIQLLNFING